ncbi:ABC transporter [Dehalococcoides mccartyi]|uniref:ABC transporter ATP-binding protein n=1 Tax=Dehalococcoides mccartyi TaxID=61435 RepID=UPI0006BC82F7|nr:ABC transporter ATP-binding protein [Dehalococcoides mccartyi]AQX74860.1 ABC transporter [Dehalococcoides mccartyi]AQY73436.1 ABC transporter [Dehalococcoides mccartyi]BAS32038.1 ABC transporter ATP-binding protein/permease [Dehalococcoides mccartyi IBARAKI]
MWKLIKSLKPFTWSIILIFTLLLGQAMSDLSLPDLMSRIINVGIQQQGIENATPSAIRSSEMNRILLFVDSADKASVTGYYTLLDKDLLSPADYNQYIESYPGLANESIYKLNTNDENAANRLNSILSVPILMVSYIESGAATDILGSQFDLPDGADIFSVLASLPQEQLDAIIQSAASHLSAIPESMVAQSDVSYLATEYQAIGIDLNQMQMNYMVKIGGLMLLLTLVSVTFSVAVGFLAARVAAGFGRDTRRKVFTKVESYSNSEFDKFSTASLITRSTNDIQQIQMILVMLLRIVFYAPIMGVGGIIKALGQDVSMSWIIASAVMAILAMIGVIFVVAIPKFRIIQKFVDKLNLVTREMLSGLMVVRAFNKQQLEENKFEKANVDLTKTTLFINRVMVFMMPAMMLIMNGVGVLIIWVGAHQIDAGAMQVGNMMAFMQYSMQIIMAFLMVSMVFVMMPRATVSAQRIAEVLETEPGIEDPKKPVSFDTNIRGKVEFQNVGFKYPGADDYVLKDISFATKLGQTTAIVGGTGSGKSTLVNLIPRFYDITEGQILIDNTNIRNVTQHDLRDKIGYIPQKTSLFSGTIESNIAYGNENADADTLKKAARIAQLTEYIDTTENGFNTPISQGGANISGGQKQRMAIARAVAKQPEIYIFDDSFSAIDFKTDATLRKALKKETHNATVLIVAQRINTVMNAEQIIVLENGMIVGKGTHKELMENCIVYRELALSQLSREELSA